MSLPTTQPLVIRKSLIVHNQPVPSKLFVQKVSLYPPTSFCFYLVVQGFSPTANLQWFNCLEHRTQTKIHLIYSWYTTTYANSITVITHFTESLLSWQLYLCSTTISYPIYLLNLSSAF